MADILSILAGAAEEGGHAGPEALWLQDYQWVSVAMLILIGIIVWKKVPGLITGGLDARSRRSASSLTKPSNCAPKLKHCATNMP